jgi:hypothetical protein
MALSMDRKPSLIIADTPTCAHQSPPTHDADAAVEKCVYKAVIGGLCYRHYHAEHQLSDTAEPLPRRVRICLELLDTEERYLEGLGALKQHFIDRLRSAIDVDKPVLKEKDIGACFLNVEEIHRYHRRLCR